MAVMTTLASLRSQDQNTPKSIWKDKDEQIQGPVTDYNAPLPSDPAERARREARSKRFDLRGSGLKPDDAKRFRLTEKSRTIYGLPDSHAPIEPPIPAAGSDSVVVGQVTDAKAYLSNDKTGVYSEFSISIEEVLKGNSIPSVNSGSTISAERAGGRVRFPSGKVLVAGVLGKTMPRTGRRYLFFLKYSAQEEVFSIITGYELRAGRVFPLDGNGTLEERSAFPNLAKYDQYENADEAAFLNEVRRIVSGVSSDPTQGGAVK
jgi:hypothetical protein